jgi:hypothetical protein
MDGRAAAGIESWGKQQKAPRTRASAESSWGGFALDFQDGFLAVGTLVRIVLFTIRVKD